MNDFLWHLKLRLAGLRSWRPLGTGQWLAWLAYDVADDQRGSVPSRWFLRWNTWKVEKEQVRYFEHGTNRLTPDYRHEEVWLFRLDVTPFFGRPFTLWEIDHDYTRATALYDPETPDRDGIRRLGRRDFYSDAETALRAFQAIAQGPGGYVRCSEPGEPHMVAGASFRIPDRYPSLLYAGDDWRDPLDVIDLTGRDVHDVIETWLAGRLAAGLPRTSYEAERLADRED